MGITISLSKLHEYFRGWHESEYDQIHRVTDDIISDTSNAKSKWALSSYGASKLQAQMGNINLSDYVKINNYNIHTNQKATKSTYGHVILIDNLDSVAYKDGEALSAYQGNVLKQGIEKNADDIADMKNQLRMNYKMYMGRIPLKSFTPNSNGWYTTYSSTDIANMETSSFFNSTNWDYGIQPNKKIVMQPGYYVFVLVVDENQNGIGNQRVVIEINDISYFRVTNNNGVAAVRLNWGIQTNSNDSTLVKDYDDGGVTRRPYSDRWYWITATLLPTKSADEKLIDKSVHKVLNYDPDYFDASYNAKQSNGSYNQATLQLWRNELGLKSDANQGDYMFYEYGRQWLRRYILRDDGYPGSIQGYHK